MAMLTKTATRHRTNTLLYPVKSNAGHYTSIEVIVYLICPASLQSFFTRGVLGNCRINYEPEVEPSRHLERIRCHPGHRLDPAQRRGLRERDWGWNTTRAPNHSRQRPHLAVDASFHRPRIRAIHSR